MVMNHVDLLLEWRMGRLTVQTRFRIDTEASKGTGWEKSQHKRIPFDSCLCSVQFFFLKSKTSKKKVSNSVASFISALVKSIATPQLSHKFYNSQLWVDIYRVTVLILKNMMTFLSSSLNQNQLLPCSQCFFIAYQLLPCSQCFPAWSFPLPSVFPLIPTLV